MSDDKQKVTAMVEQDTYKRMKACDRPMTELIRDGIGLVFGGDAEAVDSDALSLTLQPEIQERINGHAEDKEAYIREAVAEKLARESNHKRHLNANESVSMNFTDFEARFIGDVLWEASQQHSDNPNTQIENEYRWMARRFHAETKTREEMFDGE